MNVLLILMTATSMLFAKIFWAHTPARANPDIQETGGPVVVRRDITLLILALTVIKGLFTWRWGTLGR